MPGDAPGGAPVIEVMADLRDQVPALNNDSSMVEAIGALAAGISILGNEQAVDNQTKQAVREMAAHAAAAVTRHNQRLVDAERVRPMTDIPQYQNNDQRNDDIEEIKTPGLEIFKGSANKQICLSWLSRIMSTARQHRLTDAATIHLMKAKCSSEAFDSIEQDLRENNGLETIVISLERKFAGVCLPDEALVKCNSMRREGAEPISVFGDRLNKMARIATRHIIDDQERRRQERDLTISNVKRILPVQTKHDLEERIKVRRDQGKAEFTVTQLMAECDSIEQRRLDRLGQIKDDLRRQRKSKQAKYAARLANELPSLYGHYLTAGVDVLDDNDEVTESQSADEASEGDDDVSADESEDSTPSEVDEEGNLADEEIEVILNAVKQVGKKGFKGKNKLMPFKKAMNRISKGRNDEYPPYVPPPGPP